MASVERAAPLKKVKLGARASGLLALAWSSAAALLAFMVACWLNFTSQLILCYIILQLIASSKAQKERNESSHIETVRVTEFDESAEI